MLPEANQDFQLARTTIMGWASWSRKSQDPVAAREPLGVDLNASRARAAHGRAGRNKIFVLDEPLVDLILAVSLEKKVAEVGQAALTLCRRMPHVVCAGYLPLLGRPHEFKSGRHALNAEAALALAFDRLRISCRGHDGFGLALPTYLTVPQVSLLHALAEGAKLKIRGTTTTPLALAAERATHFLHGQTGETELKPGRSISPTSVLIVDSDDHALTATVVRLAENEVRTLGSVAFPRLSTKFWRERLLDAISDRCVRMCRRDPRDSAEAEQLLFDQLEECLDRTKTGQKVSISIRSTHWYQDLVLAPSDLDGFCAQLCRQAVDEVRNLLSNLNEPEPPRAVWLTHDAGRLPGLAAELHHNMTERTNVRVLHPEAAAAATANLVERWATGELPRTHLDAVIPLPVRADARVATRSSVVKR